MFRPMMHETVVRRAAERVVAVRERRAAARSRLLAKVESYSVDSADRAFWAELLTEHDARQS